jgi:serine/threonine protein kinase
MTPERWQQVHGTLARGVRLGPYEVVELVGAGGMGEVYRAHDMRLNRDVALKVIPGSYSSDPNRRQRLQREARAISALQHPNICTLHDIGQQDGTDYLVMEYLEGETLSSRLIRGQLSVPQILTYGIEVSSALDAAHKQNIIHRDLKPGNILITSRGECKVLDFGLAKLEVEDGTSPTVTKPDFLSTPGIAMGTVPYMSPEQARGEPLDARTDIFSLGTVLYEMATGKMAFPGKTSAIIFKAILDSTPISPHELNHSLPGRFDEVIGKCLEKDRELRYQSASELRGDLKRLKRDSESSHRGRTGMKSAISLIGHRITSSLSTTARMERRYHHRALFPLPRSMRAGKCSTCRVP